MSDRLPLTDELVELAIDESDPWDLVIEREDRGTNRLFEGDAEA